MCRTARYAVIGSGRWGSVIHQILGGMGRESVLVSGNRQRQSETSSEYASRLRQTLADTKAAIAWLCVSPGPHVAQIIGRAMENGMQIIVEKPWLSSRQETEDIIQAAAAADISIGIDYEYCFLEELDSVFASVGEGTGWELSGKFVIARENRLKIPASQNLGCHLVAIQKLYCPSVDVGEIKVGYSGADCRLLKVRKMHAAGCDGIEVDFTRNREPLVQRFVRAFEEAAVTREAFPMNLVFAQEVHRAITTFQRRGVIVDISPQ